MADNDQLYNKFLNLVFCSKMIFFDEYFAVRAANGVFENFALLQKRDDGDVQIAITRPIEDEFYVYRYTLTGSHHVKWILFSSACGRLHFIESFVISKTTITEINKSIKNGESKNHSFSGMLVGSGLCALDVTFVKKNNGLVATEVTAKLTKDQVIYLTKMLKDYTDQRYGRVFKTTDVGTDKDKTTDAGTDKEENEKEDL